MSFFTAKIKNAMKFFWPKLGWKYMESECQKKEKIERLAYSSKFYSFTGKRCKIFHYGFY